MILLEHLKNSVEQINYGKTTPTYNKIRRHRITLTSFIDYKKEASRITIRGGKSEGS